MKRRSIFFIVWMFVSIAAQASDVDALQAKLKTFPDDNRSRAKATLYVDLGMARYKSEQMAEAAKAFESALDSDTSSAQRRQIYLYLGKSYESSGRLDKAISAYEEAVVYDRRNWRRHRDLGGLYEQAELYWKAIASYKKALDLSANSPEVFFALGRTWRKVGLYAYAEKALLSAKGSENLKWGVYQELSYVYEGQGRFLEAAQACEKSRSDNGIRLMYLAALSGDAHFKIQARQLMAQTGIKQETRQAYENLVQLLSLSPKEIVGLTAGDPSLRALIKSQITEGTKP